MAVSTCGCLQCRSPVSNIYVASLFDDCFRLLESSSLLSCRLVWETSLCTETHRVSILAVRQRHLHFSHRWSHLFHFSVSTWPKKLFIWLYVVRGETVFVHLVWVSAITWVNEMNLSETTCRRLYVCGWHHLLERSFSRSAGKTVKNIAWCSMLN